MSYFDSKLCPDVHCNLQDINPAVHQNCHLLQCKRFKDVWLTIVRELRERRQKRCTPVLAFCLYIFAIFASPLKCHSATLLFAWTLAHWSALAIAVHARSHRASLLSRPYAHRESKICIWVGRWSQALVFVTNVAQSWGRFLVSRSVEGRKAVSVTYNPLHSRWDFWLPPRMCGFTWEWLLVPLIFFIFRLLVLPPIVSWILME